MTEQQKVNSTPSRTLVMACATVMEEILPLLPGGMHHKEFDFGLHINPGKLRTELQEAIDGTAGQYDTIILGYGMCSQAIIGIKATHCRLVVPRVDDCIAIFLGSRTAYTNQTSQEPGTYYLTKGWIEVGDTPFTEFEKSLEKYGREKAEYIYHSMMCNYKRLALINTGQYELAKYRKYSKQKARQFGLRYEEVQGSDAMIRKMLYGPWDEDFVVIESGAMFLLEQFIHP